jgi:hypothetical protein
MARVGYGFKLIRDFFGFARQNKAYWIIPLIAMLGLVAAVVVVGQASAPLLYTLF